MPRISNSRFPNPPVQIKRVARSVRKWAEAYQWVHGFPYTLAGLCCSASFLIFKEIKATKGLSPVLYWNDHHAFVFCEGFLVDVTATQFKRKQRVVIEPPPVKMPYYWEPLEGTRSLKFATEVLGYFGHKPNEIISSYSRFLVDGNINPL